MKQKHHRVVFKPVRGLPRTVHWAIALAVSSPLSSPQAWSQILADPSAPGSQRPTILSVGGGVPLINITTPSAAGVSRNTYRQFDVGSPGAILNNSRTGGQSQLGGAVPGNPWLATGPARVILNEVNSSNPSFLNGPIEVAGQRAEVIVANPSGIQVNGSTFINASGVTLTTGTPVLQSGSLDAYIVQRGSVGIFGSGLDARGADYLSILSRATEVNAGLWANYLKVVNGANTVDASTHEPTGAATPLGEPPRFLLDVAAIGGMYANHIFLVGTEKGLGVNNQGVLSAQADLVLLADGRLVNKGLLQGNAGLNVQAGGIENGAGAQISGQQAVSLSTPGDLSNAGLIDGVDVSVAAGGVHNTGRLYGDQLAIAADSVLNAEDAVIAAREHLSIQARDTIGNQRGALILSGGDMALSADRLENRSARIEALGDLDIQVRSLLNANERFETELVTGSPTPYVRLRHEGVDYASDELGLNFSSLTDYADDPGARVLLPSDDYPFAEYPALAALWAVPASGGTRGFQLELSRHLQVLCHDCNQPSVTVDTYASEHPIWARLGVAPPGPAPSFAGTDCAAEFAVCTPTEQQAHQAWLEQSAQYATHKSARQDALDVKIEAYNASVAARTLRDWTVIDASETRHEPRVLHSEPGQIVSGGDLRVQAGEAINDKSQILAGGALTVLGTTLDNRDAKVLARSELSGQAVYSYYEEDCWACNDDRRHEYAPYSGTSEYEVTLSVASARQHAPDAPTAPSVNLGSALFQPVADPASGVLFQTDPNFTQQRRWTDAGAQLALLALDPNTLQKRLGDGFLEQRLVREQIAQLTGQRFLGDYTSDDAQYLALLTAGATFAQAHELRPGIVLTAEQVAALTSDIVWLEAQEVTLPDGRTVTALVPRVYLMPREGDLNPKGSLIAGRQVQIDLSGDFLNSGSVAGRELVLIDANGIRSSGRVSSEGTTVLRAEQDIDVRGGEVVAKDALLLDAGRDVFVASTTRSNTTVAGDSTYERTVLDRRARLVVNGEAGVLIAQAGQDMILQGAEIRNEGSGPTVLVAGRDLLLPTVSTGGTDDIHWSADHRQRTERREDIGTDIEANGDVTMLAGRDLLGRAVNIQAQGDIDARAAGALLLQAGERSLSVDEHHRVRHGDSFNRKTITEDLTLRESNAIPSELSGRNVTLLGGAGVYTEGTRIRAEQDVDIDGAGTTVLGAAQDQRISERHIEVERRVSGLGGSGEELHRSDTTIDALHARSRAHGTDIRAGGEIRVGVGERTELQGARLQAEAIRFQRSALLQDSASEDAQSGSGELILGATVDRDISSVERHNESDRVWQSMSSQGHERETLNATELHGKVSIEPTLRVSVDIGMDRPGGDLRQQIEQLSRQPGLQYLAELAQRPDVDWRAIELARREWDHEAQGLTGVGAALLMAVIIYFTGGMGTDLAIAASGSTTGATAAALTTTTATGATVYTTAGAAINAGFTTLAGNAAVSFVNNGGDLSAVLKDLGSSDSVKQLLVGMAGAGLVQGLSNNLQFSGKALSEIGLNDGFGAYFGKQLVQHMGRASANALLLGTPLDQALEGALVSSLLSTGTAFGADAIGDLGVPDGNGGFTLNEAGRHVLHALLGCASGAVQAGSEGCAAGGAGAVLGELGAGWFNPDGTRSQAETLAFAQLMGSLGGALATGNAEGVGIGGTAGGNAAEHNYLNHRRPNMLRLSEVEQYERAARECAGGDASACGRRDALADLSRQRDRELQSACGGATPTLCNSKIAEARSMGNAVHGSDVGANGQLVWANSPKAGFALNVATAGEAQPPAALRQNFHVQLAQSTSEGVFLLLPGPEDVVVGALLLTAPGKVLAEVVFEGGHKLLRFADGTMARVGSEEAKLLARARIDNNFSAEMPGYGGHAVRDFQPGTTHRAEVVNAGQVTDRDGLPRVDEINTANNRQIEESIGTPPEWWLTQRPAWKEGTLVTDRVTTQMETYRMVVDANTAKTITDAINAGDYEVASRALGAWATKDPINSVADVRNNLAISSEWKGQNGAPMFVVEFKVQPGTGIREGTVGPMYDRGTSGTLPGGGHQVQFVQGGPRDDPSRFIVQLSSLRKLP
jgi:filamentous hemagglutinin family protein